MSIEGQPELLDIEEQLDYMYEGNQYFEENDEREEQEIHQEEQEIQKTQEEIKDESSYIPKLANFSFKEYLDSDVGNYFNILKSNMFLENNKDYITEGLEYNDPSVDIAIVCMYSENKNNNGISSSIFEAFEIYQMLKINSLPPDLGGPVIKLIFTDYNVDDENKRFGTKTYLGPNNNYGNEILKAIFIKYDGTKAILNSLQNDCIFLNRPSKITIKKNPLPYSENTIPSNLLIIDGPTENNIKNLINMELVADNLHLPILDRIGFGIELYNSKVEDVNFFCLYLDKRLKNYIYNLYLESPRVYLYDDIKRIAFGFFRHKDLSAKDHINNLDRNVVERLKKEPNTMEEYSTKNVNYRRYCLYLTPNSRAMNKVQGPDGKFTYPIEMLDDIIDSLRSTDLNPIAKKIKDERNQFIETVKSYKTEETEFIKEAKEAKKFFANTNYTLDDIFNDKISIHFVLIGLNENNRDFEEALLHRALLRGIYATSEVYSFNELPIENIHSKYDVYIYTPTNKDWDASPRFIPEAIYYGKKIYFTKLGKKETKNNGLKGNYALLRRIEDTEKHFGFINEDDIYHFPKMQLTRNLLGYWPV